MAEANGEMLLNVTEKDIFEGRKATTGGVQTTWFDPANLTPNNNIKNSIAFINDSCDIWAKNKYYQAIPTDNGKVGQVLVCDEDGRGKWGDLSMEDYYSYGVKWRKDSTYSNLCGNNNNKGLRLIPVGNSTLHKELPIQNGYKGCIYNTNNRGVKCWLNPSNWNHYPNGNSNENPDGLCDIDGNLITLESNDEIMIYIPQFYGIFKSYIDENDGLEYNEVRISQYRFNHDWIEIPAMYINAFWLNNSLKSLSGISGSNILDESTHSTPVGTSNISGDILVYNYYNWIFGWNYIIENKKFNIINNGTNYANLYGVYKTDDDISSYTTGDYNQYGNNSSFKNNIYEKWHGFELPFKFYFKINGIITDNSDNIIIDRDIYDYVISDHVTGWSLFGEDFNSFGSPLFSEYSNSRYSGQAHINPNRTLVLVPYHANSNMNNTMCPFMYGFENNFTGSLRKSNYRYYILAN